MYCFSQAYGLKPQWNSLKLHKDALKKNCRNPGDRRRCSDVYKMSIRRHLTLGNARSYDDILDFYWSVPEIPPDTLIFLLCTDSVYFILTYLLSMLATVTLLIVGLY